MPIPRLYVPKSTAREHVFADGGSILKLGFDALELARFAQEHQNERGYLNLCVGKRRMPGKHGDTHYVYLDEWKPTAQHDAPPPDDLPGVQPPKAGDDSEQIPF